MHTFNSSITLCVPVYNEETVLEEGLQRIQRIVTEVLGRDDTEILVVNNASTDRTKEILEKLKSKNIRPLHLDKKGLGIAFKTAIQNATNEYIALQGIDMPFGTSDWEKAIEIWPNYDIIYGSKAHPDSVIEVPLKRKIASLVYRSLLKFLFDIRIRDTQGSIFLKKSKVLPLLQYCSESNAFFTSQLAIYANAAGLKITEIPIVMNETFRTRKSKYNIIKDGKQMFDSLMTEHKKLSAVKADLRKSYEMASKFLQ